MLAELAKCFWHQRDLSGLATAGKAAAARQKDAFAAQMPRGLGIQCVDGRVIEPGIFADAALNKAGQAELEAPLGPGVLNWGGFAPFRQNDIQLGIAVNESDAIEALQVRHGLQREQHTVIDG